MRFRLLATALLALPFYLIAPASAHADEILYSVHGSNTILAADVSYLSTDGFLNFSPAVLTPTTTSDMSIAGNDNGIIQGLIFADPTLFMLSLGTVIWEFPSTPYSLTQLGTQDLGGVATLTITDLSTAVTPEPSSFMLLGTGLLGIAGVMKRRFA